MAQYQSNTYVLRVSKVDNRKNDAEKISEEINAENSPKFIKHINQYSRSEVNSKQNKYKANHTYVYHGQTAENKT